MSDTEGKRYAGGWMDVSLHRELTRNAARVGLHPSAMAVEYIRRGCVRDAEEERKGQPSFDARLFLVGEHAKKREAQQTELQRYAYQCLRDGDEEGLGYFRSLCEEGGFSADEILSDIQEWGAPSREKTTKISIVEQFLRELLKPREFLSQSDVMAAGSSMGYSEYLLNKAKRNIGAMSTRKSSNWVWYLPPETGQEPKKVD